MGGEAKTWLVFPLVVAMVAISCMQHSVLGAVPGVFIFGDSISDCGNNNNLPTKSKANFLPYGIDFPAGPTGRFSNGLTSIDKITQLLGFEQFIPPFAYHAGTDILKGVNYASGSSGIRDETGTNMGTNINLGLQIENHRSIVAKIASRLGGFYKAKQYLDKCLYYVNIGTFDYELNYFLPDLYNTSRKYSPVQYAEVLTQQLSHYLKDLYKLGARKYVLVGLDRLGCIPNVLQTNLGHCIEDQNSAAFLFNDKLKSLVDQFNNDETSPGSKFIFINTSAIGVDKFIGSTYYGSVCCPQNNENGLCLAKGTPCSNRSAFEYWDEVHTSEAANLIIAIYSCDSSNPAVAYPSNIKDLAEM